MTVCLGWDHKCHSLFVAASQSHSDYLYVLQAQKIVSLKVEMYLKKYLNCVIASQLLGGKWLGWKIFKILSLISEKKVWLSLYSHRK